MQASSSPLIGTLRERSLHAAIKAHLQQQGDQAECLVDGFVIDLRRGSLLMEVQTANFASLRAKLAALLAGGHIVHLYFPLPLRKWIARVDRNDTLLRRRRSPRRGQYIDLFSELISLRELALHPNFELRVLLVEVEEVWRDDGAGSWRKKYWSVVDQQLLALVEERRFASAADYLTLLPADLPTPFSTADLAESLGCSRRLAGKTVYTLRAMGLLDQEGRRGRAFLYQRRADRR